MSVLERLVARPRTKAAYGPGVGMYDSGTPLSTLMSDDPQKKALQAIEVWKSNIWVRACERTISSRLGVTDWWLTDEAGDQVTDDSPDALVAVRDVLARPYTPQEGDPVTATPTTFRALRSITSRHMGVVGYAFWYLDQVDALEGTPLELLYIHPARMVPAVNKQGGLVGWVMDPNSQNPTAFETDEVLLFNLEEPDHGFLGAGLVESAMSRIRIAESSDKHARYVLDSGGRRAGIYSPAGDTVINEETFVNIQRDLRAVADMPDASKRSLVLRGPMEFQETSSTPSELNLTDLAELGMEGILALWGVPKTQLGLELPAGLNSGGTKDADEEILWKNAIGPRADNIAETLNIDLLSRYEDMVGKVTYGSASPSFDDQQPKYTLAQSALQQPLRNVERRAILGLEPTGDPAIDDAVWLPVGLIEQYTATPHDPESTAALAKARIVNPRLYKKMREALHDFLQEQAVRIGNKVTKQAAAIKRKPNDTSPYWNEKEENRLLAKVMAPYMLEEVASGNRVATKRIPAGAGKAAPILPANISGIDWEEYFHDPQAFDDPRIERAMKGIGRRVTQVNSATVGAIKGMVNEAIRAGTSPAELGRMLRGTVEPLPGDKTAAKLARTVNKTFASELRAETIARTELRVAQSAATIDTYADAGIEKVEMLDGTDDPECAARNGQVVSLEEARQHAAEEHPNGTLDFAPVV